MTIKSQPATSESVRVDVGRILDEGRWTGYQRVLVLLAALTIIFDGADNQLLGIALPAMMADWSLPRTAFATALASGLFGMMVGGALAGLAGDRVGRKAALIGSVLVFGVATCAIGAIDGLAALTALRFLAGLGLGGALPNATALASEYVPRPQRPLAVTLTIVCVPLGGTLAGLFAIDVIPNYGWRSLFAIGGAVPVAVALGLMWMLPESPRFLVRFPARRSELSRMLRRFGHEVPPTAALIDSTEVTSGQGSFPALFDARLRSDTFALWVAFFSCLLAVYLGFNWVPSMLAGAGFSPEVASSGITAFNLGGVAGAIVGALSISRVGSRITMLTMAAAAVAGAVVLRSMAIEPGSGATPIVVVLGITGGLINAVQTTMYALAAHVYRASIRATGVGTAIAIGRSGAVLSTYAGARALESGGSSALFTLVGAAMIVTLVSLAIVKRHIAPTS